MSTRFIRCSYSARPYCSASMTEHVRRTRRISCEAPICSCFVSCIRLLGGPLRPAPTAW